MAKKKKSKSGSPQQPAEIDPGESRAAVAITVAWMLTTLSCVAAQAVSLAMWGIARAQNIPPGKPNALDVVSGILLAVACLTGVVILGLAVLVLWIRKAPPPTAVTGVSLLIGLVPLVTIVVLMFV